MVNRLTYMLSYYRTMGTTLDQSTRNVQELKQEPGEELSSTQDVIITFFLYLLSRTLSLTYLELYVFCEGVGKESLSPLLWKT